MTYYNNAKTTERAVHIIGLVSVTLQALSLTFHLRSYFILISIIGVSCMVIMGIILKLKTKIRLNEEGITIVQKSSTHDIKWKSIKDVSVLKGEGRVVINYKDEKQFNLSGVEIDCKLQWLLKKFSNEHKYQLIMT